MSNDIQAMLDVSHIMVAFVRAAIRQEPYKETLPESLDWRALYCLAQRHKLVAAVWRGISISGYEMPEDIAAKWRHRAEQALSKELRFEYELSEIFRAFDKEGIAYLHLKGNLIRDFWPQRGIREFSDHDILIRKEQRQQVEQVMLSLGYTAQTPGEVHDVYHKAPIYNVEIHLSLFAARLEYAAYFNRVWERVLPDGKTGYGYRMTNEDFYLYFLAHFAKHYQNGGAGLRSFADLYLMRQRAILDDVGYETVHRKLEELGLWSCVSQLYRIADVFFDNSQEDIPEQVWQFIVTGGAYGSYHWRVHNQVRRLGKLRFIFTRLFPPYGTMCIWFGVLRRVPVLLPVCWILRLIKCLFKREHWRRFIRDTRAVCRK